MRQPKTREVSWMMMMGMQDDTVTLSLEVEGKQRRYSLNGNEFRRQLDCLKKSGFNLNAE